MQSRSSWAGGTDRAGAAAIVPLSLVTVLWVVLAAVVVLAIWFWVRLRVLATRLGTFPCAVRTATGWTSGLAAYDRDALRWYRVISLANRPARVWPRRTFQIVQRRSSGGVGTDISWPGAGAVLQEVECRSGQEELVLAMGAGAYAGLASWLESAPPGTDR